jgi:hypothetical protein
MLHEEVEHVGQENERLRAELGRLGALRVVIARLNKDNDRLRGLSERSCWRGSAA